MVTTSNSYSTLAEKEFLVMMLEHAISDSSKDDRDRRIAGLVELQRRITSNSIQNKDDTIRILLDMATLHGNTKPESSLIIESLELCINKYEVFQIVLDRLENHEDKLFLCFSKVVLSVDYNKKRQSIKPLIDFLMTRDSEGDISAIDVYDCLISLGNEKLGRRIVEEASLHLDSSPSRICTIIFSVRLCSRFADNKLSPNMLEVLKKSMKGYFPAHSHKIEKDICQFFERVRDLRSLPTLMELLKVRTNTSYYHITEAIAKVLDTHPYRVEDVIEQLYDNRKNGKIIAVILQCFDEMETPKIDARKLLSSIRINWWSKHPFVNTSLHRLIVKLGKQSKPALFEILREKEKYDFALACLKEIGISDEELSNIFPKSLIFQIYDFFYRGKRKFPKSLDNLWEEKEKLGEPVPGKMTRLDHLLLNVFSCFNFVTLFVDPAQRAQGVDLVCFYHETLDLFIIGCTTGVLKDDLSKMDALMNKMETEVSDLFDLCTVTPIVVSSETASISPLDEQYAAQNNIVIMQREHIDTLLEMLNTNRHDREVIKYIKSLRKFPSLVPNM